MLFLIYDTALTTLRGDLAMSERKIMSLIMKAFGLYCFLIALPELKAILIMAPWRFSPGPYGWHHEISRDCFATILFFIAYSVIGYLLLTRSDKYAGKLYPLE